MTPPVPSAPPSLAKTLLKTAGLLLAFVLVADLILSGTKTLTQTRIEQAQARALMTQLAHVFPASAYDNALIESQQTRVDAAFGTLEPVRLFVATLKGQPAGIVYLTRTHKGYSGEIEMVIGIDTQGVIQGVRVISHKETPGLGDKIETLKHDWITQFKGLTLGQPPAKDWSVKKDGGVFDQFTGATITPRAVVAAIKATLDFHQAHQSDVFARHTIGASRHE